MIQKVSDLKNVRKKFRRILLVEKFLRHGLDLSILKEENNLVYFNRGFVFH